MDVSFRNIHEGKRSINRIFNLVWATTGNFHTDNRQDYAPRWSFGSCIPLTQSVFKYETTVSPQQTNDRIPTRTLLKLYKTQIHKEILTLSNMK